MSIVIYNDNNMLKRKRYSIRKQFYEIDTRFMM